MPKITAADVVTVAKFLRDSRASGLKTKEGVSYGKRVDFFEGKDFVSALKEKADKLKDSKLREEIKSLNDTEIINLANRMIKDNLFHRARIVSPASQEKHFEELDKLEMDTKKVFSADGIYCWILAPSQTRVWIMSFGLLFGAILLCLFKVWPLWAKIAVWWCSVIMLISMVTIFIIRIVLSAIFSILGFKGLWLFPDLFNDDIGFLETWTPLIGYGRVAEEKKQKKLEKERREKEKLEKEKLEKEKATAPTDPSSPSSPKKEDPTEKTKSTPPAATSAFSGWNFGFINFAIIMLIGLWACNHLGILAGENIPEFLISQQEIWNTYPSLLAAPPNGTETTAEEPVTPESTTDTEADDELSNSQWELVLEQAEQEVDLDEEESEKA